MKDRVAVIGAGVSGLTTAIVFAERGYEVSIFAREGGRQTTSGAAAAIWFPYDAEPASKVIPWALETYDVLFDLACRGTTSPSRLQDSQLLHRSNIDCFKQSMLESGVSMIELRQYSRDRRIEIPDWAHSLGASVIPREKFVMSGGVETSLVKFRSGFRLSVPLTDTTVYLDYLRQRLTNAGGSVLVGRHFEKLEEIDPKFDLVINCAGFGAKALVHDADLEPHRGQVAIVPKLDNLQWAIVCDDAPLMYAIPRNNDCVFGGTNDLSDNVEVDRASTERIVTECARVLKIERPQIVAERVGLRPFRKSGVRVEVGKLNDGRTVIHNYGHGGAGFTLSWGCATEAFNLVGAGNA